jgi:hypothetical protein
MPCCADGRVVGIQPTNIEARAVMPQLPIADHLYSNADADVLQQWRAQRCDPASQAYEFRPVPPIVPVVRAPVRPEQFALLEVTVHPDARTVTVPTEVPNVLTRMAFPVRFRLPPS